MTTSIDIELAGVGLPESAIITAIVDYARTSGSLAAQARTATARNVTPRRLRRERRAVRQHQARGIGGW